MRIGLRLQQLRPPAPTISFDKMMMRIRVSMMIIIINYIIIRPYAPTISFDKMMMMIDDYEDEKGVNDDYNQKSYDHQ